MTEHTIIVSNIGQVYTGPHINEALRVYEHYVDISVRGRGRGGGESVTWLADDEPYREYLGTNQVREILEAE